MVYFLCYARLSDEYIKLKNPLKVLYGISVRYNVINEENLSPAVILRIHSKKPKISFQILHNL